eukprot:6806617-Prymnesium_polylepis.1
MRVVCVRVREKVTSTPPIAVHQVAVQSRRAPAAVGTSDVRFLLQVPEQPRVRCAAVLDDERHEGERRSLSDAAVAHERD